MRHYVLATYDITDDRRLRKMFRLLRGYGDHIQYSVFLCQLTDKDIVVLKEKIKDIIHHKEDQAILLKLGHVDKPTDTLPKGWGVIGRSLTITDHSVMIF